MQDHHGRAHTLYVGVGCPLGEAHHFAKVLLKRAKTDAIDAQTLARLGALLQPAPWTPPAIYTELQQRLVHRDGLLTVRQQIRNQLHALTQQPYVVASVRARLVALITTAWLLTATLNFTLCPTPEAATAYAGLAPHAYQSGSSVQKRPTIGHTRHARLHTVLYLASLSAAQHNPAIKPFYDRLRAAGKSAKVARCAAARKLLHIAWAVAGTLWVKGQPFDPHYHMRQQAQQIMAVTG